MPYVAACKLKVEGRTVKAGDEIPEAETWEVSGLQAALRAGTVVFIPPQLLSIPPPTQPPQAKHGGGKKGG